MRLMVALWDNTENRKLKFSVSVSETVGDEFVLVSRISFDGNPGTVPPQGQEAWYSALADEESGDLNRALAGMGYEPGNRDAKHYDVFGILRIPEPEDGKPLVFNLLLHKGEEFYDIAFDLEKPSEWMTLAQKDAGMIGMWMSAAAENLTDGFYDVGHSVVPTEYDIMLDREIDREHEKQWCRENGIEW